MMAKVVKVEVVVSGDDHMKKCAWQTIIDYNCSSDQEHKGSIFVWFLVDHILNLWFGFRKKNWKQKGFFQATKS